MYNGIEERTEEEKEGKSKEGEKGVKERVREGRREKGEVSFLFKEKNKKGVESVNTHTRTHRNRELSKFYRRRGSLNTCIKECVSVIGEILKERKNKRTLQVGFTVERERMWVCRLRCGTER